MPTLGDIANQAKALLEDIKANTAAIQVNTDSIKNDTTTIKINTDAIITSLNLIDTNLKSGFTNLSQGIQVLILLGMQQNQLLSDNNKQNDTIICWLTNIANTLCDIKHNTDEEVTLQTDLSMTLHHIDDIGELVHSREALDVANRYEMESKMDKCCPSEKDEIPPCFNQCDLPDQTKFDPINPDWNPVKYENDSEYIDKKGKAQVAVKNSSSKSKRKN